MQWLWALRTMTMTHMRNSLETDRLFLTALSARQLKLWIEDMPTLEAELNCTYRGEPVKGFFVDIVKGQIAKIENDEENQLFHTFWLIIRKADRIVVGSTAFKGAPNEDGEIEIGYGLGEEFWGNGYMTETVQAICNWAKAQKNVSCVIAETESGNPRSENVLRRCGFVVYKQSEVDDTNTWWRA